MRKILSVAIASLIATSAASAQQVITNGGFETAGLVGWGTTNGGSGSVNSNLSVPFGNYGAASGSGFAYTTQSGPGQHELYQSFTLTGAASSALLTFSLRDQTSAETVNTGNFDYSSQTNQHISVDLFAGSYSAFQTSGALANFFVGGQPELGGDVWQNFSFDVTAYLNAPGTYYLRFAEVDNAGNDYMGVDNVSLDAETAPEPASLVLIATGLIGIAGVARRRRNKTA